MFKKLKGKKRKEFHNVLPKHFAYFHICSQKNIFCKYPFDCFVVVAVRIIWGIQDVRSSHPLIPIQRRTPSYVMQSGPRG
jgi:hypothetical protein